MDTFHCGRCGGVQNELELFLLHKQVCQISLEGENRGESGQNRGETNVVGVALPESLVPNESFELVFDEEREQFGLPTSEDEDGDLIEDQDPTGKEIQEVDFQHPVSMPKKHIHYECDLCPRKFPRRFDVEQHRRTHTG